MCISGSDLAARLTASDGAATPIQGDPDELGFLIMGSGRLGARLDSPQSTFLRQLVDAHSKLLEPTVVDELRGVGIFGSETLVTQAIWMRQFGRRQIVVFDGLLKLMQYYARLVTIIDLLERRLPDDRFLLNGSLQPVAQAFSQAGFSLMAGFVHQRLPLPAVETMLGPRSSRNVEIGFLGATMFVILHELGHLRLHAGDVRPSAEERAVTYAIEEEINARQRAELEADEFAFQALRAEVREQFISSVLFFLGPFAFLEAFAPSKTASHPLFVNRGASIAKLLDHGSPISKTVADIIESQTAGILNLAERRQENKGDIVFRIHETMPIELAQQTIDLIMQNVARNGALLDADDVSEAVP